MVRGLEYDIREKFSGGSLESNGEFFELALWRADHILGTQDEFDVVCHAARAVGAHVWETRDMRHVPDGGHTFLVEDDDKKHVYYFMHCRDSYLVRLWILERLRGAKVCKTCYV